MKTMIRHNVICSAVLFAAFTSLVACGQGDQNTTTPVTHRGQMNANRNNDKCRMGELQHQVADGSQLPTGAQLQIGGNVNASCQTVASPSPSPSPTLNSSTAPVVTPGTTASAAPTTAAPAATVPADSKAADPKALADSDPAKTTAAAPTDADPTAAPTKDASAAPTDAPADAVPVAAAPIAPAAPSAAASAPQVCPALNTDTPQGFKEVKVADIINEKKTGVFQLDTIGFSGLAKNDKTNQSASLAGSINGVIADNSTKAALTQLKDIANKCNTIQAGGPTIDTAGVFLPNSIQASSAKATVIRSETITPVANNDLNRKSTFVVDKSKTGNFSNVSAVVSDAPQGLAMHVYSDGNGHLRIIGSYSITKGDVTANIVYIGAYTLK